MHVSTGGVVCMLLFGIILLAIGSNNLSGDCDQDYCDNFLPGHIMIILGIVLIIRSGIAFANPIRVPIDGLVQQPVLVNVHYPQTDQTHQSYHTFANPNMSDAPPAYIYPPAYVPQEEIKQGHDPIPHSTNNK
ncbi:unnamed protein product [Meganyctiphanes norvegica]|uniref:Transmembrane protein n=1 Tax=Meganyctiphanes norvegica TaxID=48144 RepID=A0AAV2QP47_MEGNR